MVTGRVCWLKPYVGCDALIRMRSCESPTWPTSWLEATKLAVAGS